jgi:hypothetical protein
MRTFVSSIMNPLEASNEQLERSNQSPQSDSGDSIVGSTVQRLQVCQTQEAADPLFQERTAMSVKRYQPVRDWQEYVLASDYDGLAQLCKSLVATGINIEAILADEPTGKYIHPQLWAGLKEHRDHLRSIAALIGEKGGVR